MNFRSIAGFILCLCLLTGCSRQREAVAPVETASTTLATMPATTAPTQAVEASLEAEALSEAPPPAVAVVLKPQPTGILRQSGNDSIIDYSHAEDGYVMAKFTLPTDSRLKVLVKGPSTTYSYNLTPEQWAVFPLSDGNGRYQVGIYQNVVDSKYAVLLTADFDVTLTDEFAPFLRPNQYVNYTDAPNTVALGTELTGEIQNPLYKVAAVYDHVVSTISYDYHKAATVKSGYLPDLDQVLEAKTGICFDYAALMAAMLRSQQIPCKLVVGYAGSTYHAWISVWTAEHGWIEGAIFFDGLVWTRMDPTFASSGDRSEEIMRFIKEGNYTTKYLY